MRILPGDDDVIEIDPGWNEGNSVASLIMAGLCFATAGLFSWLILRNAKMTRKVETEGITAQAEILSAQTSGGYVNVKVRFDTSGGETG